MYLVLLTIIYCVVTQLFNLDYALALGLYLVSLSVLKGVLSKELSDVFNFKKTHYLYEKIGLRDTLSELLSLLLVNINAYLIDYDTFSTLEFFIAFFIFAVVYRFLFWGITMKLKNFSTET